MLLTIQRSWAAKNKYNKLFNSNERKGYGSVPESINNNSCQEELKDGSAVQAGYRPKLCIYSILLDGLHAG